MSNLTISPAYSSFGLRHLLRCAGFRVIAETKTLANAAILAQLWLSYLYKVVVRWPRLLRIATFLVVAHPDKRDRIGAASLLTTQPRPVSRQRRTLRADHR
jgi:hypothetical protein